MHRARGVLVVDDMPHTRRLVCRMLDREGFDTFEAEDGPAAYEAAGLHSDDLTVALVDVDLGGPPAREIGDELQRRAPAARVVFMSDSDIDRLVAEGRLPDNAVVLRKPFTVSTLVRTVRASRR